MSIRGANDFNGEKELETVVAEIYEYLTSVGVRRFDRWVSRRARNQQLQGWTSINSEISQFVRNPQKHYSPLMKTIDNEKIKFANQTKYVKELNKSQKFLAQGPKFSNDFDCHAAISKKLKNIS